MIFYIVVIIFVIWSVWGLLSSKVEQAKYIVTKKEKIYEIRKYPKHIVAQTTVKGPYEEALNQGFRNVADYIFGGNVKKQSIAMTAPVLEKKEGEARVISFVMPSSYTIDSLPTPLNSNVKIVTIPEKKFAVIRFSWYRSEKRIKEIGDKLLAVLLRDGVEHKGSTVYAGYNAPGTPPWLIRNEVLIELKQK